MVKRIKFLLLVVLWMGLIVRPGAALEITGTVIDTFRDGITVSSGGKVLFNKGDRVELSYRAGQVEMTIGQYEILQVKENIFVARQLAVTMVPLRDMNVSVMSSLSSATNLPAAANVNVRPVSCGEKRALAEKMAGVPLIPPGEGLIPGTGGMPVGQPAIGGGAVPPGQGFTKPGEPILPPRVDPGQQGCRCQDNNDFKASKAKIISGQDPTRRWWLGVALGDFPSSAPARRPAKKGVWVCQVDPGSPADKAGIKRNDLILQIEKEAVNNAGQFVHLLNQTKGKVRLVIDRDGKIIKKKISLEKLR